jgi:hypothetical protein
LRHARGKCGDIAPAKKNKLAKNGHTRGFAERFEELGIERGNALFRGLFPIHGHKNSAPLL